MTEIDEFYLKGSRQLKYGQEDIYLIEDDFFYHIYTAHLVENENDKGTYLYSFLIDSYDKLEVVETFEDSPLGRVALDGNKVFLNRYFEFLRQSWRNDYIIDNEVVHPDVTHRLEIIEDEKDNMFIFYIGDNNYPTTDKYNGRFSKFGYDDKSFKLVRIKPDFYKHI